MRADIVPVPLRRWQSHLGTALSYSPWLVIAGLLWEVYLLWAYDDLPPRVVVALHPGQALACAWLLRFGAAGVLGHLVFEWWFRRLCVRTAETHLAAQRALRGEALLAVNGRN